MATLKHLAMHGRVLKRRRSTVAALAGAPMRKAVIVKVAITTPRKPNSAKRKYAKVRVIYINKRVHAHIPGIGVHGLREYAIVMIEGGNPPDTPGVNYSLIRGLYDFEAYESIQRSNRRSKFGVPKKGHVRRRPSIFGR